MEVRRDFLGMILACLLLNAMFAGSAFGNSAASRSQTYPLRITILSVETHTLSDSTPVPKDCDLSNFSAYCHESADPISQSVLQVRDAGGEIFRITCTTDARWSKCSPLPVGETFDARREKSGITIVSWTSKGRERKQFYQFAASGPSPLSGAAAQTQPDSPPPPSPLPASAPPPARGGIAQSLAEKVRCNFSSTPPGADITIDGSYVGNTPSAISLTVGRHVVMIARVGYGEWKRELMISADSDVNVTAVLRETRP